MQMRCRGLLLLSLLASGSAFHPVGAPRRAAPAALASTPTMAFLQWPGPKEGERKAAVERILNVELARLITAVNLNLASLSPRSRKALPENKRIITPTPDKIADEMENRAPMIRWALTTWVKDVMGIDREGMWCPTLKKFELHPWQWTPKGHPTLTTPTLVSSLRALKPTLVEEIRTGIRSSPLRVIRLAYRAAVVYALAAVAWLPGPVRPMIQRNWPRLVEHLATTIETSHRLALAQQQEAESEAAYSDISLRTQAQGDEEEQLQAEGFWRVGGVLRRWRRGRAQLVDEDDA